MEDGRISTISTGNDPGDCTQFAVNDLKNAQKKHLIGGLVCEEADNETGFKTQDITWWFISFQSEQTSLKIPPVFEGETC